ncbi:TPR repeat-containing protein YrrB [Symmachiella dynata]|uniref:tetratricopeptide repeat protein n=1 Tax=Symmachiella dynata TaxID=2527995 RepID=UPI001187F4FD|nr:tetratricopeptide repeat protein [Symmachiella dynata]QDT50604.1 TPR repeat-containing protein YrrB [Symmachiella dynata]
MAEPPSEPASSNAEKPQKSKKRRRISPLKKVLFSIVATVVFFGAMELMLAAFGVNPITYNEDPFVGFTSRSPLYEEVQAPDGTSIYTTASKKLQWFNPQAFPAEKAKGDYRIFCVGGSTTYGRPYNDVTSFAGWLRTYLNAADPSHPWEVINAGGISYASYRVASLMEELVEYQPDLFIIYCGQNEFLERRTYSQLMATPSAVRETGALVARSRIYASVRTMLGRGGGAQSSSATNKLPEEVEAILDGSIGPDDYIRDEEQRTQTIEHFRFNLERMIEIARSVGARVVMVNPAANERNMSPFKNQHSEGLKPGEVARWQELMKQGATQQQSGDFEEALKSVDQAIAIDPHYAQAHFVRGEILYALKQYPEAKQAFQRAIDEDVCPLRILPEMQTVVKEVAAQFEVPLVDFQELVETKTETGITGEEWFLDHVHPTIDGYRELALSLLSEMESQGIVKPRSEWTEESRKQIDEQVMASIDDQAHGTALRNLAKVLSWARKYEEAGRLSQLAASKLPEDAETLCMAAYDFERNGQLEQAKKTYEKALLLQPDYAHAHYNLGHVHRRLKKWDLAAKSFQRAIESDPNYPGAHYNLGLAYQELNQLDLAAECFETSISVNEKHPGSWEELGNVRLNQNKIEEAVEHLEKAIQLEPNLASAHNSLGIAFAKSGQMQKAAASFERALAISPQFEAAQQNLQRARNSLK